jgi:hypothetical protein
VSAATRGGDTVDIVVAHAAHHLPGGWLGAIGLILVSIALLVLFAMVVDRRPPP